MHLALQVIHLLSLEIVSVEKIDVKKALLSKRRQELLLHARLHKNCTLHYIQGGQRTCSQWCWGSKLIPHVRCFLFQQDDDPRHSVIAVKAELDLKACSQDLSIIKAPWDHLDREQSKLQQTFKRGLNVLQESWRTITEDCLKKHVCEGSQSETDHHRYQCRSMSHQV